MSLTVACTADPVSGPVPLTVNFTGDAAGGTGIYTFAWDFGDGGTGSGPSPSHTYLESGAYGITLTVTDTGSNSGSDETGVLVEDTPPPDGLAGVYVEAAEDVFDYGTDWKETMDGIHQPGGGLTLTASSQDATLVGQIPFNKIRSAARYFLGFSWADGGAPYRLHREPPAPHPLMPQLRCAAFSPSGYVIKSNSDNGDGSPYIDSPFEDQFGDPLYYGGYNYSLCTVRYKSFGRMRFLPDEDIGDYTDEYKRWCTFNAAPQIQTLEADGSSQLLFAEGDPSTAGTGGKPLPFPAPLLELMGKCELIVNWREVPWVYLNSDPDVATLDKILPRLGTVNEDAFLGYSKGTLLLRAVKAEEMIYAVTAADPTDYPLAGMNITFILEHFDPPKGVPNSEYRGHRVFPYRKDGLWYYCTRENNGKELLPLTAFWGLFSHQADPSI